MKKNKIFVYYKDYNKLLKTGGKTSTDTMESSQIDPEEFKEMLVNNVISSINKLKNSQEEMNYDFFLTQKYFK